MSPAELPASGLGRHLLVDFHGVDATRLNDAAWLEAQLYQAARAAGATPLGAQLHHFGSGMGVTGVLLLQESHISIHTWPEHRFAAIDVFMCGACQPERAVEVLRAALQPEQVIQQDARRGQRAEVTPGFT
jgi:S-adenosylmethionine decarboxylase